MNRSGLLSRFSTPYSLLAAVAGGGATALVVAGLVAGGGASSQAPAADGRPAAAGAASLLPLDPLGSASGSASASASAGASASGSPSAAPSANASATLSAPSVASAAVQSVSPAGQVVQDSRVAGRSIGGSVLYNGRSVWVFGDTSLQNPGGLMSNSASATTDLDASNGVSLESSSAFTTAAGAPASFITATPAEQAFENAHAASTHCTSATDQYCGATLAFWPGPVIADPGDHRVLVFYAVVCAGGGSGTPCGVAFGDDLGGGIAALDMDSGTVTRLTNPGTPLPGVGGPDPTLLFPADHIFSAAALVVGTDVYAYGPCSFAGCELSRAPLAQVGTPSAWRYHTASGAWSADAASGDRLIGPGGAGQSVFHDPALGAYVNVFMPFGSDDVDYQVAAEPYGPWSKTVTAAHTPGGSQVDYGLVAHPEYAQDNGLIQYLTYYHPENGALGLLKVQFKAP